MIKVWTDAAEAGLLDRHGERGSTFAYLPATPDGARGLSDDAGAPSVLERAFWPASHFRDESAGRRPARASAPCFRESHRHVLTNSTCC